MTIWRVNIMNKRDSLNKLIQSIYSNNSELILSESDIKRINDFFKSTIDFEEEFEKFFEKHADSVGIIYKLKSGKYELEKQYKQNKALQPGILSECNYIETLAKIFKLNKCLDFDKTPINKVPLECRIFLNSGHQTFSAARYLYYNPKNPNIFLFQYGNPANGDAEIVIDGNKLRLEFKERTAKAGEYDITGLYDEAGKLLISDDFKAKTPEYIPFIDKFNSETNLIEQIGHNYNDFDEETKILSIKEYFTRHQIDAIISSTSDNELIILTPDCVMFELPDGRKIINTENSEIRTSGRNHRKVFTKKLFNDTLKQMKAIKISNDIYKIDLSNTLIEIVNGRGTNIPSRVKFNKVFYVNIKDAEIKNNTIIFNTNDVKQLIPSISMHIQINASKSELKELFEVKN